MAKMAGNKKNIFLLGDFNIDFMKNDIDANTSTFLDLLTSNLFVPHIIHPTRITPGENPNYSFNLYENTLNTSSALFLSPCKHGLDCSCSGRSPLCTILRKLSSESFYM